MSGIQNMHYSLLSDPVKVSGADLNSASNSINQHILLIEEALMGFITCAEGTADIWNGDSADEFRRRCASYRSPVLKLTSHISQSMDKLKKITGLYEQTECNVAAHSEELPSDAIV